MTRYTVVWVQSALDELVKIWLEGKDRRAITIATSAIDQELGTDAESKGLELAEGLRWLNVSPLRVVFTARAVDRMAEILLVRRV